MRVVIPARTYNLRVDDVIRKVENMDIGILQNKKYAYLSYIYKYRNNESVSRENKVKLGNLLLILQRRLRFGIKPIIH